MPIVIPQELPAFNELKGEKIFVMSESLAVKQDIRPLKIALVNLMPTKKETERQILRLLGNTPLQVEITFIKTGTYESKSVSKEHMDSFYTTFDKIKGHKFDGMIITGAPVETLEFTEVGYWDELCEIMAYAEKNVTSTLYICWGAQAAMQFHYGIGKRPLEKKLFGIFKNYRQDVNDPLLTGLDDAFNVPHSRHTSVDERAVRHCDKLEVLADGLECGISIVKSKDDKKLFFFGHSEYEPETLKKEYERDVTKGLAIERPKNYFIGDTDRVEMNWRSTGSMLFANWVNYYVYQVTPYELE